MKRIYLHFSSAYGTIWLILLVVALVTQSRIDAGEFGLFGFPVLSLIYALIVKNSESSEAQKNRSIQQKLIEIETRLEHLQAEKEIKDTDHLKL